MWIHPVMAESSPNVVVLAGPNGAGKSTSATSILKDALGVNEFVNADVIAQGLSGFEPERAGLAAGRIMLARLRELARQRSSFAFETTLASRSFAPWIADLMRTGYQFHLVFLWLPHPDLAVARVAARVRDGGHDVPEETIRRRYEAGLSNFFRLYQPMASTWKFCDDSGAPVTKLIAAGEFGLVSSVANQPTWEQIQARYNPWSPANPKT
jgi:predicted ABC-type ATPase